MAVAPVDVALRDLDPVVGQRASVDVDYPAAQVADDSFCASRLTGYPGQVAVVVQRQIGGVEGTGRLGRRGLQQPGEAAEGAKKAALGPAANRRLRARSVMLVSFGLLPRFHVGRGVEFQPGRLSGETDPVRSPGGPGGGGYAHAHPIMRPLRRLALTPSAAPSCRYRRRHRTDFCTLPILGSR